MNAPRSRNGSLGRPTRNADAIVAGADRDRATTAGPDADRWTDLRIRRPETPATPNSTVRSGAGDVKAAGHAGAVDPLGANFQTTSYHKPPGCRIPQIGERPLFRVALPTKASHVSGVRLKAEMLHFQFRRRHRLRTGSRGKPGWGQPDTDGSQPATRRASPDGANPHSVRPGRRRLPALRRRRRRRICSPADRGWWRRRGWPARLRTVRRRAGRGTGWSCSAP